MKRFIITAYFIIFSTIMVLALLVENYQEKYSNMWHVTTSLKHQIASGQKKVEPPAVISLGNSQMYTAFIPEVFGDAYNLSIPGTMIIDQYYLLKKYLENNPAPQVLIHGLFPQNDYYHYYSFWNFHVRYGAYDFAQAFDLLKNAIQLNDFFFSLEKEGTIKETFKFLVNFISYKFHLPHVNQDILQKIFMQKPSSFPFEKALTLNHQQKGYYAFASRGKLENYFTRVLRETQITKDDHFEISPLIQFYLDQMIELTKKHQIHYVVIHMPNSSEIQESTGERTMQEAYAYYSEYLAQYPHTTYLRMEGTINDSHFADNMHYQPAGAMLFTEQLKKILVDRKILEIEPPNLVISDQ